MNVIAACRQSESRAASLRILSKMGVSVHEAESGQHAADMLDTHSPDMILLEADSNGSEIQVCRKLRRERQFAGMIGVWVTPPYSAAEWLDNGADAFLQSSSDDAILSTTVRTLLQARNAERELATAKEQIDSLQGALRLAQQEFQQFAMRASHDFQESLRAITVFSQLIAEERGTAMPEREQQYLVHVMAGTQRMRALLDSILLYSQSASDNSTVYAMVDLKNTVHGAVKALKEAIASSGARVDVDPGLPSAWVNSQRVQQVFQSLIANAIAYRRPDRPPEIRIEAKSATTNGWLISVRDNGIGIEKQYHESVFAPFKRLHGRDIPGCGLGLAICRKIVEGHGGQIWVESSPAEGSTFQFTLQDGPTAH